MNFARNVKNLTRGDIPNVMSSELFEVMFKDLTPEGARNLAKMIGPANMKAGTERWLATTLDNHLKVNVKGETIVNWDALATDLGLHSVTSSRYATTEAMLKLGQHPMDIEKLGRFIGVLKTEIGPTIPEMSKMYMRGAALSGPQAGLKSIFATKAFSALSVEGAGVVGNLAGPVAVIIGLRKFSKFLVDPDRLNLMARAFDPALRTPGLTLQIGRQLIRYLATDIVTDRNPGEKPNKGDIAIEETRLLGVVAEVEKLQQQSRQPKEQELPFLQGR